MASYKLALFIAVIAILQSAHSNPDVCDNDCDNKATQCVQSCPDQPCANGCTAERHKCYDKCVKFRRGLFLPVLAKESDFNDVNDDEEKGFENIFQK